MEILYQQGTALFVCFSSYYCNYITFVGTFMIYMHTKVYFHLRRFYSHHTNITEDRIKKGQSGVISNGARLFTACCMHMSVTPKVVQGRLNSYKKFHIQQILFHVG